MQFYTNVTCRGNKILVRGYDNGVRFNDKISYSPKLFIPFSDKKANTEYKTMQGDALVTKHFDKISEARDFVKQYEEVENFNLYGMDKWAYAYIHENYPDHIDYDRSLIRVANIDIEVESDEGFPKPDVADQVIDAITIHFNGTYYVLGLGEYKEHMPNVRYKKCRNEESLLRNLIQLWRMIDPDIVTGWYIQFFDVPYLINRINNILGEDEANKLSPWGFISQREVKNNNNIEKVYTIAGVEILDYMEMRVKYGKQEAMYKLDYIASKYLGLKKLDYSEHVTLKNLRRDDYQKYIEYNIRDVELVQKLDDKWSYITMVLAIAYDSHVNYTDAFSQVRMWDVIIYRHLDKKGIAIPPNKTSVKTEKYAGAYVKDPQIGGHDWVASFDLTSLYPMLIQMYNIGPDTLEGYSDQFTIEDILNNADRFKRAQSIAMSKDCVLAANGQMYRKDHDSFLTELMESMYLDRAKFKKMMIQAKIKYEQTGDDSYKTEASKMDSMQLAKKVGLNSAYGAVGNQYFRYYDTRNATAITISGQLTIRWIVQEINIYLNHLIGSSDVDYVVASDTDSMYLNLGPLVKTLKPELTEKSDIVDFLDGYCKNDITNFIDDAYIRLHARMNAHKQTMDMKREVIADRGIWRAKKNYILNVWDSEGVRYDHPELKVMGLESVKSSTPAICVDALNHCYRLALEGNEKDVHAFISKFKEDWHKRPFEDIAKTTGLSDVGKYKHPDTLYVKGTPIHVRGSIVYNDLLVKHGLENTYETIKNGDKVKFCYMTTPNPIDSDVISIIDYFPSEFGLGDYIDYKTQYKKTFENPILSILNLVGMSTKKVNRLF
jgi:DNA polymerase elongation subunit (family B)